MSNERRLWGRNDWEPIIEEYLAAPTPTHREFTEPRGLKLRTFRRWLLRLRRERQGAIVKRTSEFVEVELPQVSVPLVRVAVGDVSVEFETLPPPAWVAELAAYRESYRC